MPVSPTVYNAFVKLLPLALFAALCARSADLRVGVIGTDTSHVPAFTQMLNSADGAKDHVPGARVVAAYKGGSKDIESSVSRVDQYAEEVRTKWGVEIVPDIATLLDKVDAVMLTSVDGRIHLEQMLPLMIARKPVF